MVSAAAAALRFPSGVCRSQYVGLKALVAGDVTAASTQQDVAPKSLESGTYTFWQDDSAGIGNSTATVTTTSFATCLSTCDRDQQCAGVTFTGYNATTAAVATCSMIKGDTTVASFKRTVMRTVTSRLAPGMPSCCRPRTLLDS